MSPSIEIFVTPQRYRARPRRNHKPAEVKPVLRAAVALFRRHLQTHQALTAAESRLRERDVVDRAKAILIRTRKLSEPEAYRWLRREAMASARRIPEIALTVVQAHAKETP